MNVPEPVTPASTKELAIVKRRLTALALVLLATGACSREGELTTGGIYITRSVCPQVAIPAETGDITLFSPPNRTDAASLDVSRSEERRGGKDWRSRAGDARS